MAKKKLFNCYLDEELAQQLKRHAQQGTSEAAIVRHALQVYFEQFAPAEPPTPLTRPSEPARPAPTPAPKAVTSDTLPPRNKLAVLY